MNRDYFDRIMDIQYKLSKDDQNFFDIIKKLIEIEHQRYIDNVNCKQRGALQWNNNSCYMDSVLLPILTDPPLFVRENIFSQQFDDENKENLRRTLIEIHKNIRKGRHGTYCVNLREKLYGTLDVYKTNEQQDAGEFLTNLLELFNDNQMYEHKFLELPLSNINNIMDNNKNLIGITLPIYTDYKPNINDIPERINNFNLKCILIKTGGSSGGHYTCYYVCKFKNENKWYYYDDTNSKNLITLIGDFDKVKKYNDLMYPTFLLYKKL